MPHSPIPVKDLIPLAATLRTLESAVKEAFPKCATLLNVHLLEAERQALSYINALPLSDGSWYRPIHHLMVTMAMIRICESTNANRDLVLAAILHDIGYSVLEIPGTLQGAAWEGKDVRLAHMAAGREISEVYLKQLIDAGTLSMSDERLQTILSIIATHDDPYIGKPLSDKEALLHRDADRLFVLSCVSFWKDYIALLSDSTKLQKLKLEHVEATPQSLLELRRASFVQNLSNGLSQLATFEPVTSDFAQKFFNLQCSRRFDEISTVLSLVRSSQSRLPELAAFFTNSIVTEFKALIE